MSVIVRGVAATLTVVISALLLTTLASKPDAIPGEPPGRDNSPAAVHRRMMILDGWLGSGPMPCRTAGDDLLANWAANGIDSGVWWVRDREELETVHCWLRKHRGAISLAARAGDAPHFHTEGRSSLYIGVTDASIAELSDFYDHGVRFARVPQIDPLTWIVEARRLGLVADVGGIASPELREALSYNAPPLVFGWRRRVDQAPDAPLLRKLGEERDGVVLMMPSSSKVVLEDMRACLRIVRWKHCAVGGAADPEGLTASLLLEGFDEGNVARMFGFDLLRVLRKAEVGSGQR